MCVTFDQSAAAQVTFYGHSGERVPPGMSALMFGAILEHAMTLVLHMLPRRGPARAGRNPLQLPQSARGNGRPKQPRRAALPWGRKV